MKYLFAFFAVVLPAIVLPFGVFAEVIINEIAWMGTENSFSDEWIELYNSSSQTVNLEGWKLMADDESPKITLSGSVAAGGFYLLERTDDNAVPGITADWSGPFGSGGLKNSGERLVLYDNQGALSDEVLAASGWFAGDNATKQTMERKNTSIAGSNPNNWQTSQNSGGTPRAQNSAGSTAGSTPESNPKPHQSPAEEMSQLATNNQQQTKNEQPVPGPAPASYPDGVLLNEILPSPEGPDDTDEFIEIRNLNGLEVNLSGWQIQDSAGSVKNYLIPKNTLVAANGFVVFFRPQTNIALNNEGDGVSLRKPDGRVADEVSYNKSPIGQSYNRDGQEWSWSSRITSGSQNVIVQDQNTPLAKRQNSSDKDGERSFSAETRDLAATILPATDNVARPLVAFGLAMFLALMSCALFIALKRKKNNKDLGNYKIEEI